MAENHPFLDFKAIKARAPIADVLARYGVSLSRVNQTTLRGACPLPSHTSAGKTSFYANEAKSVWYCHSESCKRNGKKAGGNVVDFVALMENLTVYAAAKRLDEWFPANGNPATGSPAMIPATAETAPESGKTPATGNRPLSFTLKDVNPAHPMIQERGISVETAKLFCVGFFPGRGSMAGRIVFPLHEGGQLVGYAGRTTVPVSDDNPKWLFGKGIRKSFLYGIERCDPTKPVILCESLWGPLWFHENGLQAAALMGSEMTEEQEACLDPFATITVALDNDATGSEKAARICGRLKGKHRVLKARLIG